MPRKTRVWTHDFLKDVSAVDTQEREVRAADMLSVSCDQCNVQQKCRPDHILRKFNQFGYGFRCRKCRDICTDFTETIVNRKNKMKEMYGTENHMQIPEFIKKQEDTLLRKYGVKSVLSLSEVHQKGTKAAASQESRSKAKRTMMERYGVSNSAQSAELRSKMELTNIERYGHRSPMQCNEIRERAENTRLIKYGYRRLSDIPGRYQKIQQTNLHKHGCLSGQSIAVQEKRKKTMMERYGVEHPFMSVKLREKACLTVFQKYGYMNAMQSSEILKKSLQTKINNGSMRSSQGEQELMEFCRTLDPNTRSTIVHLGTKQFQIDILMPKFRICVEYNGMFWHSEKNKQQYNRKHLDKTEACKKKGYRLIHIWENEWLHKQLQVKSYISAATGTFQKRVYARNCQIIELSDKGSVSEFMDRNHLLGRCNFTKAYALELDGQTLGVLQVGRHHRKSDEFVVNRIAFESGVQIIGGMSRLSRHAIQGCETNILTTWAEVRLGAGDAYQQSGWSVDQILPPDYFYWDGKNKKAVSKQSRRKSAVGTPEGMTEHEHALQDKLYRIYDCGKIRFVISK